MNKTENFSLKAPAKIETANKGFKSKKHSKGQKLRRFEKFTDYGKKIQLQQKIQTATKCIKWWITMLQND